MRKYTIMTAVALVVLATTATACTRTAPTPPQPTAPPSATSRPAPSTNTPRTQAPPAPSCTQAYSWNTALKFSGDAGNDGVIIDVDNGRHGCFDQVTFRIQGAGKRPVNYRVEYVSEVQTGGKGDPVPVEGGETLRVIIFAWDYTHPTDTVPAPSPTPSRAWQPQTTVALGDGPSMAEVKHAGTHEGQTVFAVGVRGRQKFQVDYWNGNVILYIAHTAT
jgi:hypothetical protein